MVEERDGMRGRIVVCLRLFLRTMVEREPHGMVPRGGLQVTYSQNSCGPPQGAPPEAGTELGTMGKGTSAGVR